MRNLFKTILVLTLLAFVPSSFAATITAKEVEREVVKQVSANLAQQNFEKFEVSVINVPFSHLDFRGEKIGLKVDKLNSEKISSKYIARVGVYVDGAYQKSVGVPISIKAYKNVYAAKHNIERDETITPEKVTLKLVDVANNTRTFLTDSELKKGVSALKVFKTDEVINSRFTKCIPDVERNAVVKVIVTSKNSITITTEAVALSEGNIGDTINLQNKKMKKIYTGKIIGENKVLVQI